MSLLKLKDLDLKPTEEPKNDDKKAIIKHTSVDQCVINPEQFTDLRKNIGDLQPNTIHSVLSLGGIHTRHVLPYVVEQIGPCKLFFTTWAISLRSAQTIFDLHNSELIDLQGCILSDRVETECPQAFQFLKSNTEKYWLKKNHAKSFIAWNDQWKVVVRMTANFTENNRSETFDIMTIPVLWQSHLDWINTIIDGEIGR